MRGVLVKKINRGGASVPLPVPVPVPVPTPTSLLPVPRLPPSLHPHHKVPVSIATFPFLHFASGHTYFTQSLVTAVPGVHDGSNRVEGVGFTPVAVHTTFQLG